MPEERPCRRCGNKTELRLGRMSNGARMPALQCLTCFEYDTGYVGIKSGYSVQMQDAAPALDVKSRDRMREIKYAEQRKAAEEKARVAEEEEATWWHNYNEYTTTLIWKGKRERVMARDNRTCQACLRCGATEVHHLTYKHAGDEPLFDLVAICYSCHQKLTQMDRNRRAKNQIYGFEKNR